MSTVPRSQASHKAISPTGDDLPFSVWVENKSLPWHWKPAQTECVAMFSCLPEAHDYIDYLTHRGVVTTLRGMFGHVCHRQPSARVRAHCGGSGHRPAVGLSLT